MEVVRNLDQTNLDVFLSHVFVLFICYLVLVSVWGRVGWVVKLKAGGQ